MTTLTETPTTYVTESGLRKQAADGDAPEGWADKQIKKAREAHLLLTDQQHADALAARRWKIGDRAQYIGPDRIENTDDGKEIFRRTGEVGTITSVTGDKDVAICVFRPDAPQEAVRAADSTIVELRFRENTTGARKIERIP